jgi:hypothetical protein
MNLYRIAFATLALSCLSPLATGQSGSRRLSIERRVEGRTFPSLFQAWNPIDNLPTEPDLQKLARHDLIFHGADFFGLQWNRSQIGLADGFTPESLEKGQNRRREIRRANPNAILLMEIRYRDAHKSYLPEGHRWWKRGKDGKPAVGWEEGGYFLLDFADPEFQEQVAKQAAAAVRSGIVDGVMLDWWIDDADRLALVRKIRRAIGEEALILVNANDRTAPRTAKHINGFFMECYRTRDATDWKRIADTLQWAEKNLRSPHINCLETWYHASRNDLNLMRATTTLSLTLSDGYCLFSDPNDLPTPDHLHSWYPFWERRLGVAKEKGFLTADGSYRREFEGGTVIYNPLGNIAVNIHFPEARRSAATGKSALMHSVPAGDGDLFLYPER